MTSCEDMFVEYKPELTLQVEDLKFAQVLINYASEAAFCLDEKAQFLFVNRAMCSITEYSREELLSMTLCDLDINFSLQNWSKQWESLRENFSSSTAKQHHLLAYESRYRTKKNRIFLGEVTITYIKNQTRELICGYLRERNEQSQILNPKTQLLEQQEMANSLIFKEDFLQEVDEYQNSESELARSLCLLRSALNSTVNGVLAVNFEGEILYCNQKFLDMWQLPKSLAISRKCSQTKGFLESQVKEPLLFQRVIWETPSQSDSESYDLIELKDGRIFAHYSEPHRLDGQIIGRVWSIWDITEAKRTEEALKLNVTRFRILAENTDASIFLIKERRICYVNRAAEELTGYTRGELTSNFNIEQLILSKKLRQVHKQDGSAFCEYQEIQICTKNSATRWLACTVQLLDGVVDFANSQVQIITAIDITDYKQAETELRQALDQAKRLSEIRERFVSMLCHQFRTPLNVVAFSADLLRRHIHQWTAEKNRSYLDLIQAAVNQISDLLDEILLFGRAESAKLKCEPVLLDINQFCRDIVVQMQLAGGNQRTIDFVSQGDCSAVCLDPKLLQHILTNLLSNAIKYSSGDTAVTLELSCQKQEVIFKVKDLGIGIPLIDQQQIFEPFYRGSNIDNTSGTGLGLSIVKILVELHRGEIAVESEVGSGTTFTVKVPSTIIEPFNVFQNS